MYQPSANHHSNDAGFAITVETNDGVIFRGKFVDIAINSADDMLAAGGKFLEYETFDGVLHTLNRKSPVKISPADDHENQSPEVACARVA